MTEQTYLRRTLAQLVDADWALVRIDNGEHEAQVQTPDAAVTECMAVDEASIELLHPSLGWLTLYVVWQTPQGKHSVCPEECIADYGTQTREAMARAESILLAA